MPEVSIIVPFYNVEKHIGKCLQSIERQTFTDFEVILIDDGSTDASSQICYQTVGKNNRFAIYHKQNEGISIARNYGLEKASGEFIAFVDSDDMIDSRYLETLVNLATDNNADIASVSFARFSKEVKKSYTCNNQVATFSPREAIENSLYQKELNNSMWGKLFRKVLFDNVKFPAHYIYEDLAIFYLLCGYSNKLVHLHKRLYFYRKRPDSCLNTFNNQRTNVLDITDVIESHMQLHDTSLLPAAQDRKLSANFNIFCLSIAHHSNDLGTINRCWENIRALRKQSLWNPKVRLKNKIGIIVSFLGKRFLTFIAKFYNA